MSAKAPAWVALRSDELSAEIDPFGAQLSTLSDREGRELLWNGDPAVWTGRAPLLFPIVGALAHGTYRVESRSYSLPRHGFARGKLFELDDVNAAAAIFRLEANDSTLSVYPYPFVFDIKFQLAGPQLSITTSIRNSGTQVMPMSFGYHPAFRWPLPYGEPRSAHFLEFAADEPAPIRRLDAAGLLTPLRHSTPVAGRRLVLGDALFQDDVIIMDDLRGHSVWYGAERGPGLRIDYPDARCLGLWTKPGADFICIEPWHGVADPVDYSGDFNEKPGIVKIEPGAEFSSLMTITLTS